MNKILIDQKLVSDLRIISELTEGKYVIMVAQLSRLKGNPFISELTVPKQQSTQYSSHVSAEDLVGQIHKEQLENGRVVVFKRSTDMKLTPSAVEAKTAAGMLFCISNSNGELKIFKGNAPLEYTLYDPENKDQYTYWKNELKDKFIATRQLGISHN